MRHLLVALIAVIAAPVLAQDTSPRFGGFAEDVATGQHLQGHSHFLAYAEPVDVLLRIRSLEHDRDAALDVLLENTSMDEIAATLGGKVLETGEAGGHVVWTCYELSDGRTLWFYSDGEMGGGKVNLVALEDAPPQPEWSCTSGDFDLYFNLPPVGSPGSVVIGTDNFDKHIPDGSGHFGFTSQSLHPDRPGFWMYQEIVFRAREGVIDAVAVMQQSGD